MLFINTANGNQHLEHGTKTNRCPSIQLNKSPPGLDIKKKLRRVSPHARGNFCLGNTPVSPRGPSYSRRFSQKSPSSPSHPRSPGLMSPRTPRLEKVASSVIVSPRNGESKTEKPKLRRCSPSPNAIPKRGDKRLRRPRSALSISARKKTVDLVQKYSEVLTVKIHSKGKRDNAPSRREQLSIADKISPKPRERVEESPQEWSLSREFRDVRINLVRKILEIKVKQRANFDRCNIGHTLCCLTDDSCNSKFYMFFKSCRTVFSTPRRGKRSGRHSKHTARRKLSHHKNSRRLSKVSDCTITDGCNFLWLRVSSALVAMVVMVVVVVVVVMVVVMVVVGRNCFWVIGGQQNQGFTCFVFFCFFCFFFL